MFRWGDLFGGGGFVLGKGGRRKLKSRPTDFRQETHTRANVRIHSASYLGNFRLKLFYDLKLISQECEVGNLKREAETRLQLLLEANDALEVP